MTDRTYQGPERRAPARWEISSLLAAAMDEVDHGLVVVRRDLSVVFANHAARRALTVSGAPLKLSRGFLLPESEPATEQLQAAIAAASERGVRNLLALDGGAGHSQELSVTPLPKSKSERFGGACLVKLGRQTSLSAFSVSAFAKLHGLSARECDVLQQLCNNLPPKAIAAELGLSLSTVRTHVHNLRRKAHAPTVLALVRKVTAAPSLEAALKDGPLGDTGDTGTAGDTGDLGA